MKHSLPRRAHKLLSVLIAITMIASNLTSFASVAAAAASTSGVGASGAPPGVPADSSPCIVAEIEASRTAESSTYQLSDGTRRAEIFTQPVHYRDAAGRWSDIDPTLVPTGVFGSEHAKATELTETFSSDDSSAPPVTVSNGHWSLGMDLVGGVQDEPFALGDRAVYPLAASGTQLVYESRRDGVKDTLVLASPDSPDTFTFFMSLRGLSLFAEPGTGGFALYDSAVGKPAGRIEPLSVYDSAGGPNGATGSACADASMTAAAAPGGVFITYHVPRAWLDDPARAYPVYVDPAVTFAGPDDTRNDTYVAKGDSAHHYADNHLDASLFGTGDLRRALVNFGIGSLPNGATINSAVLQMYLWQNSSGGNFTTICQPVVGTWGYNATWANTFGNGSVSVGTGGDYDTIPGGPNHYASWDMTPVVQKWVSGALANNGFVLYANSETAVCQHSFWSAEYTAWTSRQPHLIVDYTPPALTAEPIASAVHAGDSVKLVVHAQSRVVTNLQAKVDGRLPNGDIAMEAHFAFTTVPPGAGWVSLPVEGGYLSYEKTFATEGASPAIVPDLFGSRTIARADGRDAIFAYRIGDGAGDVQNNRFWVMDWDWQSSWQNTAQTYQVKTFASSTAPSVVTSASAQWYDESASSEASANAGRGSITLSWPAASAASGYAVYLFDGNAYEQVATTTATSWSSAGKRIWPSDSAIASLPTNYAGNPFGSGTLDLRDDPRPLWAKTAGTTWDAIPAYALKVAPFNSAGAPALSECPTVTVSLAGRTKHLADEPQHTAVDVGPIGFDGADVRADRGDITLEHADVEIPGLGPEVALRRFYRSSATTGTLAAPGWRFSFERSIRTTPGGAVYTDEVGDEHTFRRVGGVWVAPHGSTDLLAGDGGAGFVLAHKDFSASTFDSTGRLSSERDAFGNTVRYEWSADGTSLVIRTPKDVPILHERRLSVELNAGKVVRATAHVGGGDADRVVNYQIGPDSLSVTVLPSTDAAQATVYRYDASSRVCTVTVPGFVPSDSGAAVWSVAYGPNSVSVANETGAETPRKPHTVIWNSSAGTATVVSASGTSTIAFDPLGRTTLSSLENTAAATVRSYDAEGDLIAETSPAGRTHTAVFDGRANAWLETDESGGVTTRQFWQDRCVSETDPRGSVTSRVFDAATGALLAEDQTLNAAGERSHIEYSYNGDGSPAGLRKAVSGGLFAQTDYADYADCGQPQCTTQRGVEYAPGKTGDLVTLASYDGFGDMLSSVDALGVTTARNRYDSGGRLVESTDPSGTITHSAYSVLGEQVKTWRSNPATSAIAGWCEHVINAQGDAVTDVTKASDGTTLSVTTHRYDAGGREIASDDSAVPGSSATKYDAQGNVAQVWAEGANISDASASLRTSFTADGEEASQTAPGAVSASTLTSYTTAGQAALTVQPDGETAAYAYDAAGVLASTTVMTDDGAASTSYTSDLDGRPVVESCADGAVRTAAYDLAGDEVSSAVGSQTPATTRFNCLGWPLESTDSDGVTTRYGYDADGRLLASTVDALSTADECDACGRLARRTNPDGTVITHTYDVFGDEVATAETSGTTLLRSTGTAYDSAMRVAAQAVCTLGGRPSLTRTHSYAVDGRDTVTETRRDGEVVLTSVTDGAGKTQSQSGAMWAEGIDWSVTATDSAGRTTSLGSRTLPVPVARTFTQAGQPAAARIASASEECVYSGVTGKKVRDTLRTGLSPQVQTTDYDYDAMGRLVSVTADGITSTYDYDPTSGAVVSRKVGSAAPVLLSYETSGTGRLVSNGTRLYRSDSLGRRTARGTASNPTECIYGWTGDRLTSLCATGYAARYVYDARGERLQSVVTSGGLTTTTLFDYDGTQLTGLSADRSDGASWTLDYVYDDAGGLLGGAYHGAGRTTRFAVQKTARGDVRELLDASGTPFATYSYDAWGVPCQTLTTGTASGINTSLAADIAARQPLRYASYAYDAESSLYYCSARYYDPEASTFLSKDPQMADGERSAYQYCSGDPVNAVDPTGLDAWGYGKDGGGLSHGLKNGELVLVQYCLSRVGGRYVFGAKAKPGQEWRKGPLDCSGLTAAAYRVAHRVEPRTFPLLPDGSANQHDASRSLGFALPASRLRISDLGFLHTGGKDRGKVHHVGIYIGHGIVVEARGKAYGVVMTALGAFNKRGADWHRARKR